MAARAERELTAKQEAFCLEYVRCWSASDAARRAGLEPTSAYRLLQDPAVKWRLRELAKQVAAEVHIESGTLLREMMFVANLDPLDLFDERGDLLPLKELPLFARKAIREFTVETEYVGEDASGLPISRRITKVKLHPKERALEMLGRFKKLFGDDNEGREKKVSVIINAK